MRGSCRIRSCLKLCKLSYHEVTYCGSMRTDVTQVADPFMEEVGMFSAQYTDFYLISTHFIWFNENRLSRTCT